MSFMIQETAINEYNKLIVDKLGVLTKKPSKSKRASMRRETIFATFESLLNTFPNENPGQMWRIVEKAHVYSYLQSEGVDMDVFGLKYNIKREILEELFFDDELISSFESAKQSWKRSSGIAWENFFEGTFESEDDEIKVVNPRDLKKLLKGEHINNNEGYPAPLHFFDNEQKKYFESLLKKKDFDLFLLFYSTYHRKWRLFGLIQCKTSIRDRMKINASTSKDAMNKNLWSILLALDPDSYLRGQYYEMAKTDWHGVYFMEKEVSVDDNIVRAPIDELQSKILNHANQVLQIITDKPEVINSSWRPN
ncbi:hypothetical protein BC351_30100 [Paenibacillus ferrarius]|uniref:BsaWI restriction endonuclease type 2 domain-containing protein n=1 Tax=Paenibacillus ferrarius TaxID=1469647 RepID=A0A1V4HGU8_9BACL|nr:BsaWI family type II restriction enzyme [Paenibacillus ferrarius]OPH54975.1 hypothetical protein BC351_30100 [Paenibacillus ferrarius]